MTTRNPLDPSAELIIDNFAGGGGASTGIEMALGRSPHLSVNHDRIAVAMHVANHPHTRHLCEDVFAVDPVKVCAGRPVGLAWFSPDCKHFSKAKGGKPRSKKIRGLAWVMVKWCATVRPRVCVLENVEEFQHWGPLLGDGSPCRQRKGNTFRNFIARLRNLGYAVEWRELRACDYGAPTIRKRLFLIARCDGKPIVWPEPTHRDPKSKLPISKSLPLWRTAAECIDWGLPCPSIFLTTAEARVLRVKRPLAEATMRRIARGIRKFVIEAKEPFIVPLTHQGSDRVESAAEPLRTTTGAHRGERALVVPSVQKYYGERREGEASRATGADEPLDTLTTENRMGLVAAHVTKFREGSTGTGADEPLHTITAGSHSPGVNPAGASVFGLVEATLQGPFLTEHANASSQRIFPAEDPLRTICAEVKGGHFALVSAFLAKHFSERGKQTQGAPVADPLHTITATDHHAVVAAQCKAAVVASHLTKLYGTTTGQPESEPMHTITSGGNHLAEVRAFLVKYYGSEKDGSELSEPMHTIRARHCMGLVLIEGHEYVITDIGMRMLRPRELFAAQGFPADYIITPIVDGRPLPADAQVRMCGNSVPPPVAAALVAANVPEMALTGSEAAA